MTPVESSVTRAGSIVGAIVLLATLTGSADAQRPAPGTRRPTPDSMTLLQAPSVVTLHDPFDAMLRSYVHAGAVDYAAWGARDLPRLDHYLARLSEVTADSLAPADRLAFWVNLYNATMIRAVCARWREGWRPDADSFAVFRAPLVRVRGGQTSLDFLEREVIRRQSMDPRIHVALVCAARSCPPLSSRAYRGPDLDKVLEGNMRQFVADTTRNRVDTAARTLRLSRLFDWYAADFGGAAAVPDYVGRKLGRDFKGWKVEFLEYDWRLNDAAPR